MDYPCYAAKLKKIIEENYPNVKKFTVADYLKVISTMSPTPLEIPRKSLDVAEQCRTKGNCSFYEGNYEEAVQFYMASLKAAFPYSTSSALAYANRSAALYHLGAFKECIADIDRALNLPYPNNLRPKLITRRETAIAKLNDDSNRANGNESTATENFEYVYGENAKLPGVSNGIEIALDSEKKRGLVATKPFQLGDLLLVENYYLNVPILDAPQTFCHHCLKMSLRLIPCDRCSIRVYCSELCQNQAFENYHHIECVLLEILDSVKFDNIDVILVPVRCLIIFTKQGKDFEALYKDFEDLEKHPDPTNLQFTEEQFVENKRKVILSLRGLAEPDATCLMEVAYVVTLLRNYTDFFKSHNDIPRVADIFVKIYKIIVYYSFTRLYSHRKDGKAYSLYPFTSLANHACCNNTVAYIDKNERLVLRASQNIKPGDQIQYSHDDLSIIIENPVASTNEIIQSHRYCSKCLKSVVFRTQRGSITKLIRELYNKFDDVESLWKLLKLMQNEDQGDTVQTQLTKYFLVDAYQGYTNRTNTMLQLSLPHMF